MKNRFRFVLSLLFGIILIMSCVKNQSKRFFSKEKYETGLQQELNIDVLERIVNDSNYTSKEIILSFYFISDERKKIESLIDFFNDSLENHQVIELNQINNIWELNGRSNPIELQLESINNWERNLWEVGYKFDCLLDGWESTISDL